MTDLASLILRLGLGIMFAAHGLQKVFGAFGGPGMSGFSKMLEGLGFAPAITWAYIAALTELLGGLGLISGVLTRLWSSLLLTLIVVATLKVHLKNGFFLSAGGIEYNLVIASALFALLILGSGRFGITKKL